MRNTHTSIVAFISFLFFALSIAACAFLVHHTEGKKSELHNLGLGKAQALLDAQSLVALSSALRETEEDRSFVSSRILKDEDVVEFLTLIDSLSKEQGVSLVTNTLSVVPINSSFESLVIAVSIEGQYASLMQLLTLFEALPYQVAIQAVRFERSESEGSVVWRSIYNIVVTKTIKKS